MKEIAEEKPANLVWSYKNCRQFLQCFGIPYNRLLQRNLLVKTLIGFLR